MSGCSLTNTFWRVLCWVVGLGLLVFSYFRDFTAPFHRNNFFTAAPPPPVRGVHQQNTTPSVGSRRIVLHLACMPGQSSTGIGSVAGLPFNICHRPLDFPHACDLCGEALHAPFFVTRCNHCFCVAHQLDEWVHIRKCPSCGCRLSRRGFWDETWHRLCRRVRVLHAAVHNLLEALPVAALVVLMLEATSNWISATPNAGVRQAAVVSLGLLLLFHVLSCSKPSMRICMIGGRRAGKTTIGHFLESGLRKGPVFAPQRSMMRRTQVNRFDSYLMSEGSAIITDVGSALEGDLIGVDATWLNAIRLGDDYGDAIVDDGDDEPLLGAQPQPRWHAGASALLPDDESLAPVWSEIMGWLASLSGLHGTLQRRQRAAASPTQRAMEDAHGFVFVVTRDELERDDPDARWQMARTHAAFQRACEAASVGRRPLLLLCSKADENPPAACRRLLETLCSRLGVQHATAGARCFVHAASRLGHLYLPEELRRRIYAAAISDGASDAAHGRMLRLESGSALRVICGGVIGSGSAARLLEGMAWMCEASRAQHAEVTRRARLATKHAICGALAAWAVAVAGSSICSVGVRPPKKP